MDYIAESLNLQYLSLCTKLLDIQAQDKDDTAVLEQLETLWNTLTQSEKDSLSGLDKVLCDAARSRCNHR